MDKYCGGDDRPVLLTNPSTYRGFALSEFATLEFGLEPLLVERLPVPMPAVGFLTQQDFPRLIDAIREINDVRYGTGASTPVRTPEGSSP